MFLSEWRKFPSEPCLAGKKNLLTARVSMLLKSRASLTCFRACFLPGRAKDLSAPRYICSRIFMACLPASLFVCQSAHLLPSDRNLNNFWMADIFFLYILQKLVVTEVSPRVFQGLLSHVIYEL